MKKNEIKTNGKLIIALARSYKAIHKESDAMLKSYGLTNGQFAVMEALYSKGDLTVSELIEKVLTTSGNMTVLISNLEKAGMVIRRKNEADKRGFIISLSEKGRMLMDEIFPKHMKSIGEKLSILSCEEKEEVISILRNIHREE